MRYGQGERFGEGTNRLQEPTFAIVQTKDELHRFGNTFHSVSGGHLENRSMVEAVQHVLDDLVLLQHQGDRLALIQGCRTLAPARRVSL